MPIRPENVQAHWAARPGDFLTADELACICGLSAMGFEVLAQPQFWEIVVARLLGGATTQHKATHDVEVDLGDRLALAEVKFSRGFVCAFTDDAPGRGPREIFRWAKPRGFGGKYGVDAIVLIGRAISGDLFSWVMPLDAMSPNCPSITITSPAARKSNIAGRWDRWAVPFDQMLPAFVKIACGILPPPTAKRPKPIEEHRALVLRKAGEIAFGIECATGQPVAR